MPFNSELNTADFSTVNPEKTVTSRILAKVQSFANYGFSLYQTCAINVFFNLAQEFDDPDHYLLLPVLVLKHFFQVDAELFMRNPAGEMALCTPRIATEEVNADLVKAGPHYDGRRCLLPVRGKGPIVYAEKKLTPEDARLLGVLVVHTPQTLTTHELLFLEKFAGNVGFSLHNKYLAQRDQRHILFIRKLVHDIGHNVITPNIHFKLMLNKAEKQLNSLKDLVGEMASPGDAEKLELLHELMREQFQLIKSHFSSSALFLETLLRQTHFEEGHYVLRRDKLDLAKRIIIPQLERYRARLVEKNIRLDIDTCTLLKNSRTINADMGLMSQVAANLFGNAAKYCISPNPGEEAFASLNLAQVNNFFGNGRHGIQFSIFTTGRPIPEDERDKLFHDGFRATNAAGQFGTGHGLFFVREIVAEHGGVTGYEAAENGNIFYFVLPLA